MAAPEKRKRASKHGGLEVQDWGIPVDERQISDDAVMLPPDISQDLVAEPGMPAWPSKRRRGTPETSEKAGEISGCFQAQSGICSKYVMLRIVAQLHACRERDVPQSGCKLRQHYAAIVGSAARHDTGCLVWHVPILQASPRGAKRAKQWQPLKEYCKLTDMQPLCGRLMMRLYSSNMQVSLVLLP